MISAQRTWSQVLARSVPRMRPSERAHCKAMVPNPARQYPVPVRRFNPLIPAALLSFACGASSTEPDSPRAPSREADSRSAHKPSPEFPLRPTAAPKGLVMVGRWHAGRTLETLSAWANTHVDWRLLLDRWTQGFASALDLAAPLETAMTVTSAGGAGLGRPDLRWVGSVGLSSVDAAVQGAKRLGLDVERLSGGSYRVAIDTDLVCALAPALGQARARAVCSFEWLG